MPDDRPAPMPVAAPTSASRTAPIQPARRWESPWSPVLDERLAATGWTRVRLLHQMRVGLPLAEQVLADTRPIAVRTFEPSDADALLDVNNRAFAWHPEQGGWDRPQLAARMAEPWFDPAGLLLHPDDDNDNRRDNDNDSDDGRVDGFCWTKVHAPLAEGADDGPRPAAGEIFVIAVDPARHGTGLGRSLTVAGLEHLAALGLGLGMLYVEADNEPAVALYERLGFRVHHSDAGYARSEPGDTPPDTDDTSVAP